MQKRISGGEEGLRMALIACLLVVCFENLQGGYAQGQKHAVSGHALLQIWLAKHTDTFCPRKAGMKSPAPDIIEDELVHAFSRLDLQIMTYIDERPASVHRMLKNEGALAVAHMPASFNDIDEAHLYWELLQRRTAHFISVLYATVAAAKAKHTTIDIPMNVSSETHFHIPTILDSLSAPEAAAARQERVVYARDMERWFAAFAPLYASFEHNSRAWRAGSILYIQARCGEICLLTSQFGDEDALDELVPTFRELVAVGEEVVKDDFFVGGVRFTFDAGLVFPFRLIAERCRDGVVRRGAIKLLRGMGVREGTWDGVVMAGVAELVMGFEEEWVDEHGEIPRGKRAKMTVLVVDQFKRVATVRCERLDGSEERDGLVKW